MYTNEDIAKAVSAISGLILLGAGLVRLGWVIEFIPYIPISAFVTAAAVTIMATQFPTLMGITGVNTRAPPYLVIINSLKGLPRTQVDAAIGLSSIVLLYAIRYFCSAMETRYPAKKKMWAIISSLRLTFTMLLYTFISWLVNRTNTGKSPFRIVGHIERGKIADVSLCNSMTCKKKLRDIPGFKHAGPPPLGQELASLVLPEIPAMLIILVIEHVAIAKSFARTFGYTVTPSQEILAQGTSNFFGTFVGGYACTGSFGASAVLSKAGVRTPLAGLFSAVTLVLALFALPAVFYYIPMAALAGLIIHAVANLPTRPKTLYRYWQLSPLEFIIWWAGIFVAIFVSLEVSIYVTICASLALLLIRLARARGQFLGQTRAFYPSSSQSSRNTSGCATPRDTDSEDHHNSDDDDSNHDHASSSWNREEWKAEEGTWPTQHERNIYLPVNHKDASNPALHISTPYPGVFIYRFPTLLSFPNQAQHMHHLVGHVKAHTRRGEKEGSVHPGLRLWSEVGTQPQRQQHHEHTGNGKGEGEKEVLPPLRAVVLDCTALDILDITAVQGLVDARRSLDRHAGCSDASHAGKDREKTQTCVEWHFAGLWNPWARRALAVAGFGIDTDADSGHKHGAGDDASSEKGGNPLTERDAGYMDMYQPVMGEGHHGLVPVRGVDRPFFHLDLVDAVETAVFRAKRFRDTTKRRRGDLEQGEGA